MQIEILSPFVGFLWRTNSHLNFFLFLFKASGAGGRLQALVIFPVSPPLLLPS